MTDFKLPSLGADMEAGTLLEWLIKPGDSVTRGKIVAVVDTEKAAIDVEIWIEGTVERLLIEPGTRVAVGTPIAIIRTAQGESAAPSPAPVTAAPPAAVPAPAATPVPLSAVPASVTRQSAERAGAERLRISPLARRMAKDLNLDPAQISGTGPGGAITQADIERAAAAQQGAAPPAPAQTGAAKPGAPIAALTPQERSAAMRRIIAAAMSRSKREIPHYYLGLHVNLERALGWLEAENLKRPIEERLIYSVLLVKAVARAALEVPRMNGFYSGDAFQASSEVHVGMAISLRHGGLLAPALLNADRKPLGDLMRELRDLVSRTRSGSLRSTEMSAPTLTVTNLGEQGVDSVFGVIFPPQVALVGFGRVSAARTIHVSLSADHRVSDGHRGGLFLAAVDRYLQSPETL